jgi:deoxyribonuclease V
MKESLDPAEVAFFAEVQRILSRRRVLLPKNLSKICAVDAAYGGDVVVAVASLFEDGLPVETSTYVGRCNLPYVSGLFFLREGPFAVEAVKGLKSKPELVCFDAHGTAHPRLAGMATVCGMVLGIPSIGIAKSRLVGTAVRTGDDLQRIIYGGRGVGFVVRTGRATRYWSPGYSVSLSELKLVIQNRGLVCLRAMAESDSAARDQARAASA